MGDVYLNSTVVGSLEPQTIGASGTVYIDSVEIGSFGPLSQSGDVVLDSVVIGYYTITAAPTIPTQQLVAQIMNLLWLILLIMLLMSLISAFRVEEKPRRGK